MDYYKYKELMEDTVLNQYPNYLIKMILDKLVKKEIIVNDRRINKEKIKDDVIDVSELTNSKCKFVEILNIKEKEVLKTIEKVEFEKSYKYTTIFSYSGFTEDKMKELENSKNLFFFSNELSKFDEVNFVAGHPTVLKENNKITFKFCYEKSIKIEDKTEDKIERFKYVVQAVLFTDINILEIRFDQIRGIFKPTDYFYKDLVHAVQSWMKSFLRINIDQIDFRPIVKKVINQYNMDEKNAEVIPYTTAMYLKDGSKAILDIDSKKNFTRPILGVLKELIKNHEEVFEKEGEAYKILNDFIDSIEETSDFPWVRLYWHTKDILVRITHDYKESKYSLFQFYGDLKDTEMMDYVTKYLVRYRKSNKK